ncbi:unnamed protein product [Clonostachys rosea]|uniref:Amine oxidase n=1 Tax=Bionectria ochroleuca TaxID=29856 RepID=A0ABY6UG19_BIOOC|nr:unnamed protein product [Clonostachys rosea]
MLDLIVIGAGFSGLQAAYSAQQAGLSVVVVEARDRVGGKSWSVPLASNRGTADLGAAWVNPSKQHRIWGYAKQFGMDKNNTVQRLTGKAVMNVKPGERIVYPFGITPEFSPEVKKNLEYIRDHVQAESLKPGPPKVEDDNVSMDQYVRALGALPETCKMVNVWTKAMHGVESHEESAAYFIDYCRKNTGLLSVRGDDDQGGNYMRLHAGTQSIAKGIARLIGAHNILLSNPVASIENLDSHVNVYTTTGKVLRARKCIVSLPSTMWKELTFNPPLPQELKTISDNTKLGNYNKVIVAWDKPWWRDLGFNGFFMSFEGGPVALGRDTSVEEKGLYAFTLFVQGNAGYEWSQKPAHERRAIILNQLASVFNVGYDSELYKPIEIFEMVWKGETFSRGALVPITRIGDLTKYASVYGKPTGNLHFVGTEFAPVWKGYLEGALASGEVGAKEVAEAISSSPIAKL